MPKKILVVDDNADILELIKIVLSDEGYNVLLEAHRLHDLDIIKSTNPDLVIIDQLIRGDISSWEVVQKMRLDPVTAHIPVILCTASVDVVKELNVQLNSDRVHLIYKPFDIDDLVNEVNVSLEKAMLN